MTDTPKLTTAFWSLFCAVAVPCAILVFFEEGVRWVIPSKTLMIAGFCLAAIVGMKFLHDLPGPTALRGSLIAVYVVTSPFWMFMFLLKFVEYVYKEDWLNIRSTW